MSCVLTGLLQEPNCNTNGINVAITGSYPVNCRLNHLFS